MKWTTQCVGSTDYKIWSKVERPLAAGEESVLSTPILLEPRMDLAGGAEYDPTPFQQTQDMYGIPANRPVQITPRLHYVTIGVSKEERSKLRSEHISRGMEGRNMEVQRYFEDEGLKGHATALRKAQKAQHDQQVKPQPQIEQSPLNQND